MVATLAQAASAAYYLESQRSFRHPNEYYTAGEEPDGVWFNPKDLFGLEDGGKADSADFHRLYHGFAPDGSGRLTRNAGSEKRSPGLDMTFSADKSVSTLWAIADPELRAKIEQAHNDAARVVLEETVFRHCGFTRIRDRDGELQVLSADLMAAMFQHGTSRDNDPQLHTHCVIFNAARTHEDGNWRALHQHPVYGWVKAAGAVYRNALAWNLQQQLGLPMEQYGRDGEFTRIKGVPEELAAHWSKRRAAIVDAANDMGFRVEGNAARAAAANKITRAGKSPDNDPEVRHRRWRGEAEGFCEREALIAELLGKAEAITQEQLRDLTAKLETLPERLTREEAVFRLPDVVERVSNATAALLGREAAATATERVMRHPEVVRLTRIPRSAEGRADMAHTRLYTTSRTLEMEQAVRDMATDMAAETGHGLPAQAIEEKIASLMERGYPLSEEQSLAIRHATAQGGRVAVIEGAAGSGKTTTLRPIADLCREHGGTVIATAVAWRTAVALGNDLDARPFCVDKLLRLAAKGSIEIDDGTTIVVDEAGMLSTRQAHHVLRLAERHGAKVMFAGRHPAAAAGGGRAGVEADLRCCRQRPGGPHPAPEAGPRGHPDPCPRRDAVSCAVPGRTDGRGRARPHLRRLRDDGGQAGLHTLAGQRVGGAERRQRGRRGRSVARAGAPPSRPQRGADVDRPRRRVGPLYAAAPGEERRGAGAYPCRGAGAVAPDEGAPVRPVRGSGQPGHQARHGHGEPGDGGRQDGVCAGGRGRRSAPHRRHLLGEAALQRHRGHCGGSGGAAARGRNGPRRARGRMVRHRARRATGRRTMLRSRSRPAPTTGAG